jgi:nucleoid-associated protein YgaU
VTATRKIFIAAILLTAGYGVARFLGEPAALLYAPGKPDAVVGAQNSAVAANSTSTESTPLSPAGARLVPDFGSENPYQLSAESATDNATLAQSFPIKNNSLETNANAPASTPPPAEGAPVAHAPRVKLRDEAPRPLNFEPRATAPVQAQPLVQLPPAQPPVQAAAVASAPPLIQPSNSAFDLRAPELQSAGYATDPNSAALSTVTASYSQPGLPAPAPPTVSPPPWPERHGLRTHIVIDGDSLERLAGRYLDDPTRGVEIFEANRELLSSPELLPIGAELVIPEMRSRSAFGSSTPQSSLARDPSVRAAAHQVMVPVRPIPPANSLMPRARLLPPVAAE